LYVCIQLVYVLIVKLTLSACVWHDRVRGTREQRMLM